MYSLSRFTTIYFDPPSNRSLQMGNRGKGKGNGRVGAGKYKSQIASTALDPCCTI